jgi:hypothetical protein
MPDAICVVDPERCVLFVSAGFGRILCATAWYSPGAAVAHFGAPTGSGLPF